MTAGSPFPGRRCDRRDRRRIELAAWQWLRMGVLNYAVAYFVRDGVRIVHERSAPRFNVQT